MPTELIDLELEEVSLVHSGDDPLAKIAIVKCRDQDVEKEVNKMDEKLKAKLKPYMDKGMSEEEAMKAYEEDMKKELDVAKADNERLRKALIDNGFVIKADGVEKKAPEEMIEVEGEMVAKSAIPAPVLKALEAAEVAKRDAELVQKAKDTLPNFSQDVAKSFMAMDLTEDQLKVLKAADKLFEGMTEEVGKTDVDGDMNDPMTRYEKAITDMVEKGEAKNKHDAVDKLAKTKEGRELINKAFYKKED